MDPGFIYEIITINQKHLNIEFPNVFIAKNYHQFLPYLFSFTCLGEAGFAHHKFKQYFNINTKQIQKEILSLS